MGEGDGSATITVILSAAAEQTVAVDYAASDGTAQAGQDYTATGGTLSFAPGVTAQTFAVRVIDDWLNEDDETVTLILSNASNAVLGGEHNPATLTIQDDDWTLFLPLVMRAYLGGVGQR